MKLLRNKIKKVIRDDGPEQHILQWIAKSRIDRVVLLALDAVYYSDGTKDKKNTKLVVDNDFVLNFSHVSSKILVGVSIHPSRKDAVSELVRVAEAGACLVKWLPSAQNIFVDDTSCIPFFEAMAMLGMPLLSHCGVEHTIPTFDHSLNDPFKLKLALKCGVTVIGAHCGTRFFLHDKSYFKNWRKMALEYENFYGDLSTFGLPLHGRQLDAILNDTTLTSKVLYGSDFPAVICPSWYLTRLGIAKVLEIRAIDNPFDKVYLTLKYLGVPEEVFSRAGTILRIGGNNNGHN